MVANCQRLSSLEAYPICFKSLAVKPDPVLDQPEGPTRQLSVQDLARRDQNLGFKFAVASMKNEAAPDRRSTWR
jgi:hypothetical protein